MAPKKVYKRAGIIHVCHKGAHYAPEYGETRVTTKDRVCVVQTGENEVQVDLGNYTETWVRTVVGNDSPDGYARKAKKGRKKGRKATKARPRKRPERPTVTRKLAGEGGRPTLEEVDAMIVEACPNDQALGVMRACWENWYHPSSDRRLGLMQGLHWISRNDTSQVRELGQKLMKLFR